LLSHQQAAHRLKRALKKTPVNMKKKLNQKTTTQNKVGFSSPSYFFSKTLNLNHFKITLEDLVFLLIVIALPTQLGKHFWPNFSYIYSLKIDYLSPVVYLWDILVIMLVAVWMFKKPEVNRKALVVIIIFLFSQSLSLVYALNPGASIARLEQLLVGSLFALYIASQKKEIYGSLIKTGLVIAVFYESVIGILQFLAGASLNLWFFGERAFSLSTPSIATFNFYGQVYLRAYATFPHPNVFAAFLVVSLLIILFLDYRYFRPEKFRGFSGNLVSISTILAFIAGIVTFSRAAILVLIMELFLFLRSRLRAFAFAFLIALPFLFIRFSSAFNFDSLSFTRREELAEAALNFFTANPFFGIGLNNFVNQIAISELIAGPSRFLQPVHNIFLLSLSETGIVGYIGLLIFLGYPLWQLRNQKDFRKVLFILSLFLTIIFLGMFDHYFLTLAQGQRMMFLVWGLSLFLIRND
jgi:O-antigen ligase